MKGPALQPILAEFVKDIIKRNQSERTAQEYVRDIQLFSAFLRGVLPMDAKTSLPDRAKSDWWLSSIEPVEKATLSQIDDFLMWLRVTRKNSATAARRKIAALRAFYRWQRSRGQRDDNPAADVVLPKLPQRLVKALPKEDVTKILHARTAGQSDFERARNAAILAVLYTSGVRRAELVALNVDGVDLKRRRLQVIGKGNKERLVFLNPAAAAILGAYLRLRPDTNSDPALFLGRSLGNAQRKRISAGYVAQIVDEVRKISGVRKHVTPHMFRHSLGTHLYESGVDLLVIKDLLGHESVSTTQIYVKASQTHAKRSYDSADLADL